jgi:carboxypeptidase C (cathepsin A)
MPHDTTRPTTATPGKAGGPSASTDGGGPAPIADQLEVRHHQVEVDGVTVRYTTTTGRLVLQRERAAEKPDEAGRWEGAKPRAEVFFVAYTRDGVRDPGARPVTFSFNGGPGSSSVWMHLGLLGPRRVRLQDDGMAVAPPYELVDNVHTLLDTTDLVFVDPVSTGFSRAAPGEKPKDFHGFDGDVESVGDFIRLWVARFGRWSSPKFLIGESYGTTRAAALAGYLQERHALYLNGLMLVSSVLDFATVRFEPGNDLPPLLFLPTYAAAAHFHRALPADLQARPLADVLAEVEAWSLAEYGPALLLGDALPDERGDAVAQQLARYTGLDPAYVRRSRLRIDIHRFCKELLRDRGRTVGRIDARYTGVDRDDAGATPEFDPSMGATTGAYGATINDYVRRELGFESDLPYEVIQGLYASWDYGRFQNRYVNVAETLRKAIAVHPFLKVFVASGSYDLATPHFATRYTLDHLGLPPHLRGNLVERRYDGGHMMYVDVAILAQMKRDLAAFVRDASAPGRSAPAV